MLMDKFPPKLPPQKHIIATIHIFDQNCVTFWIDFTQDTQSLHDHWSNGRMFLHLYQAQYHSGTTVIIFLTLRQILRFV